MYIDDWEEFAQQALELYKRRPLQSRYCIKYRHNEGKLVLKVTDDVVCLKFKTDQQTDVKRMEKLNDLLFALMARGSEVPEAELRAAAEQQQIAAAPFTGAGAKGKKARQRG